MEPGSESAKSFDIAAAISQPKVLLQAQDQFGEPSGIRLVPGMPAEILVSTQERTAVSYLMKPFTDQMNNAFRER